MRILQINNYLYPVGGAETVLSNLTALFQKHGHDVLFFTMDNPKNNQDKNADYFTSYVDFSNRRNLWLNLKRAPKQIYNLEAKKRIGQLIEIDKPDIAIVHNIGRRISFSVIDALKKKNIPILFMLHDYRFVCTKTTMFRDNAECELCMGGRYVNILRHRCNSNSVSASFVDFCEKYFINWRQIVDKIDIFLAPSIFMQGKMIEWGIPSDKIVHLPHFISSMPNKNRSDKDTESDYFLYFGRLDAIKGIDTLIEAVKKTKNVRLVVAGEGLERKRLETMAAGDDRIGFVGQLDRSKLSELIDGAKAVVVPSKWNEVFGMTALESLARKKIVIVSNKGGLPELVADSKTGFVFQAGNIDELSSLLEKVNNLTKKENDLIGQAGFDSVIKNYDSEKYYKIIFEMMNGLTR